MIFDEKFFVATAFFLFAILVFRPVKKMILNGLDSRILRIKSELDQATKIREEAEDLLQKYKQKQERAEKEAGDIIEHAKKQASEMMANAKSELEFAVKKRTELAMQRVAQAEASALKEIKDNAVDITVSAARALIMESLSREAAEELLHKAIGEIERKYH